MLKGPRKGYVFAREIARDIVRNSGKEYESRIAYNLGYFLSRLAKKNNLKTKIGDRWYIPEKNVNKIKRIYLKSQEKKVYREYIFESCFNNPNFKPEIVRLEKEINYAPWAGVEIERSQGNLGRKEEISLFREYNWCKFRVERSRKRLEKIMDNGRDPQKMGILEKEIEDYHNEIGEIKREISSAHILFVIKTALKYKKDSIFFPDLITAGQWPLVQGMDFFDYRMGNRYLTYVGARVKKEIQRVVYSNNTLNVPKNLKSDTKETIEMKNKARNTLSLDYKGPNQEDDPYQERTNLGKKTSEVEANSIKNRILEKYMRSIKEILTEREYDILMNQHPSKRNGKIFAQKYQISREMIRVIRLDALRKVKKHPKIRRLSRENQFFGNPLFR